MTMPDPTPTSLISVLVVAVVSLAGVVVFLFKYYSDKMSARDAADRATDKELALERTAWAAERGAHENYRDRIRAEFEEKHRILAERMADSIRQVYETSRKHDDETTRELLDNLDAARREFLESLEATRREFMSNTDAARREFGVNMEAIATKAAESADRLGLVLDKFYDRLLGPRRSKG